MEQGKSNIRVLLAKPGLDGHTRGAKIVATLLRNAGMEVIYTGMRQSVDQIISAAVQEDVDVIALSILSGVHVEISRKLLTKLKEGGFENIPVVVGGVIPPKDIPTLKDIGIKQVFPVSSSFDSITRFFIENFGRN